MTKSTPDAERLASLLDGRLSDQERTEVLAQLAASEDGVETLADAAAALGEAEGGAGATLGSGAPTPRRTPVWLLFSRGWYAAAALALLLVLPWTWRRGAAPDVADAGGYAVLLADRSGLPSEWDLRPWGATRGTSDPLTAESRAVRLGARLVDLDVAVAARDTGAAGTLSREIVALLADVPASGPALAIYRDVERRAGEPSSQLIPLLARARAATATLAGEELVRVGAWLEAARLAASSRDPDFFRRRESRIMIERVAATGPRTSAARAALARVQSGTPVSAQDWSLAERELTHLLRDLGR